MAHATAPKPPKDVMTAAHEACTRPLDHFPHLITYSCLTNGASELAQAAQAALSAPDTWLASEAITMPRKGAGPRPITVLSPVARTVYATLVSRLGPALPDPSRAPGEWDAHRSFGREGEHSHVVELDYASCYETIDHAVLGNELNLRSMSPELVASLLTVLKSVEGTRGLPQMLSASDRLADAYLSVVDRRLQREGYLIHRYADDTRVVADSWEQANIVLESAAVHARRSGLILAGAKTGIRRRDSVDAAEKAAEGYQVRHLLAAEVKLTRAVEVPSSYGQTDFLFMPPEEVQKVAAAGISILQEWAALISSESDESSAASDESVTVGAPDSSTATETLDAVRETTGPVVTRHDGDADASARVRSQDEPRALPAGMSAALGRALHWASRASTPLSSQLLVDLVFHYPLRLEDVCDYLTERHKLHERGDEADESWDCVGQLTRMGRQSPWAKLWLLDTAPTLRPVGTPQNDGVVAWVLAQLGDDSEVVRAEAAWTAAGWELLTGQVVSHLYRSATSVTQPALAACVARQKSLPADIVKAIRTDSPLNEQAYQWVQ